MQRVSATSTTRTRALTAPNGRFFAARSHSKALARGPRAARLRCRVFSPHHHESPEEHAIFQSPDFQHIDVSVYDARDALEVCGGLWGDERSSCFAVFGLDDELSIAHFDTVYALEQSLELDTDPEEEARHNGKERC